MKVSETLREGKSLEKRWKTLSLFEETSILIEENVLLLDGLLLVDEVCLGMVLLHQVSVLYLNSSS